MADFTEPAFPIQASDFPGAYDQTTGLSKREWFAGQAIANPYTAHDSDPNKVAEWAVAVADALVAALKTGGR